MRPAGAPPAGRNAGWSLPSELFDGCREIHARQHELERRWRDAIAGGDTAQVAALVAASRVLRATYLAAIGVGVIGALAPSATPATVDATGARSPCR